MSLSLVTILVFSTDIRLTCQISSIRTHSPVREVRSLKIDFGSDESLMDPRYVA